MARDPTGEAVRLAGMGRSEFVPVTLELIVKKAQKRKWKVLTCNDIFLSHRFHILLIQSQFLNFPCAIVLSQLCQVHRCWGQCSSWCSQLDALSRGRQVPACCLSSCSPLNVAEVAPHSQGLCRESPARLFLVTAGTSQALSPHGICFFFSSP